MMKFRFALVLALLAGVVFVVSCGLKEVNDGPDPSNLVESADEGQDGDGEKYPFSPFPYEFSAQDLYGNPVSAETLGEKRIFFVHLWGSWCPPCIGEMPELAQVAAEYEATVGFLGLVDDYASNLDGVVQVTEASGVPLTFINVDDKTEGLAELRAMIQSGYVPTTIFIDGNGEMISEHIIGAHGKAYAEIIDGVLAQEGA